MARIAKVMQLNPDGTTTRLPEYVLDLDSSIIHFVKYIDGTKFQRTTGVRAPNGNPVPAAIVKKAKEIANQKFKRDVNAKKVNTLVSDEWDIYYQMRENEVMKGETAPATLKNIKRAGLRLKAFFGDDRPETITKERWLEFVEWHVAEYPGQSLFNARKYMRNFCRHLHEKVVAGRPLLPSIPTLKNPFARRERLNRKQKKSRVFSKEDVKKILLVCNEREQLVILFMYMMAFRIESEALSVEWSQLKLDQDPPLYVFGEDDNKAGLEGTQAIPDIIVQRLRAWHPKAKHSLWVFPQLNDPTKYIKPQTIDWNKIRADSNLDWHWTAHTFRHSCMTTLAEAGHPQHLICKLYRISSKVFMDTYAHLTPEGVKRMQNAMEVDL